MRLAHLAHLARRFVGSLHPGGPPRADEAWALSLLGPAQRDLWRAMGRADRRHACAVARRVQQALGDGVGTPVLVAALLHDVGKLDARLGTYGRVVATVSAAVAGRGMARSWSASKGFNRRVGLYLRHDELGADRLRLAGSDPLVVAWAAEHHRPEAEWTIDTALGRVLKAADDD